MLNPIFIQDAKKRESLCLQFHTERLYSSTTIFCWSL